MSDMELKITKIDPNLKPFQSDLELRMENYERTRKTLVGENGSLAEFANGHQYFGFHRTDDGWYYREWAPAAEAMYFTGDFCGWDRHSHPMENKGNGVFEIFLPGRDALKNEQRVMAIVVHNGWELERIPTYANFVVQDQQTITWSAAIHAPEHDFQWNDANFKPEKDLFIYECHIGMAQEEGRVSTYKQFEQYTLPRIKELGYNTIQIMAVMEHPYYGSFGYQVCNFFAASSKFGTPEDLKSLINTAHKMGIAVLLDVVHSHCAPNTREGLNEFDGTTYQFFHDGPKGDHAAWGTKCFNYGKHEVIHFLLSNLKFWMDEYHFDGFRFDGVTSMLYLDHGLGVAFTDNSKYFSMNTDTEAVTYLQLATELVREVNPNAILIAEDMSAMPGLCLPVKDGGIGFDYRLAMGLPDMWIRLLKEQSDEWWDFNQIYYELANRRPGEKVIGYVESHDQALVGDKTLMFRLCDAEMYWGMHKDYESMTMDRAMSLHKMLRLITMSLGGEGYLTFMGNEFGHPEWIDFPREGNGWSYHYCRRQWSLADNPDLKYQYLNNFEKDMVSMAKEYKVLSGQDKQLLVHNGDNVMAYKKGDATFIFNFDPSRCYDGYLIPMAEEGDYEVIMSTEDWCYGGHGRVYHEVYTATKQPDGRIGFQVYLPNRSAMVLKKLPKAKEEKNEETEETKA
ncbi:MAG: alpha amylase C-terminal domain-containing protein [Oscillospiraceae bacterium]|nr:alpha amylase C-terminal domain-containing protein [Oscillospiraceae bacterium]